MKPRIDCRTAWLALVLAGCSGGTATLPMHEVSGSVTLGGRPLTDVAVVFYPAPEGPALPTVSGMADSTGRYVLTGPDGRPGAVAGLYHVTVSRIPKPADRDAPPPSQNTLGPAIPIDYLNGSSSPLRVEVKDSGPQVIDLALQYR